MADLLARCQSELEHDGKVTCVEVPAGNATTQVLRPQTSTGSGAKKNPLGWLVGGVIAVAAVIGIVLMNGGKQPPAPDATGAAGTATSAATTETPANPASANSWPAYAPPPAIAVEYENSIGMKFRLIPPGEFLMGSTPEEIEAALVVAGEDQTWRERINSEAPQHKVILTQPVYVGVTEVTQAQYEQVMGTNPSHFSATGEGKDAVATLETGNLPVETVSWNDAAEFCIKLSQQEELKPFYFRSGQTVTPLEGTGYRLPTEAEWEYACRAGTTSRFWSGDEDNDLFVAGWFSGNSGGRTHVVGELRSNPFGLSDVHGNAWEWVQDNWYPAFYARFKEDAAINPSIAFSAGSQRVLRGGGWLHFPSDCRSSGRHATHPTNRHNTIGFRVVLVADSVRDALKLTRPSAAKSDSGP